MLNSFIEAQYPVSFRDENAKELGEHLRHRHSVDLVGMRRVGISNFLRFFLHHQDIVNTYINHGEKHVFISVDLNDLVERELFPFWVLTFKRIVDAVEGFPIEAKTKTLIGRFFLDSIQSKDMFLTIDGVRRTLNEIVRVGVLPTIFLIRFDRLKEAVTPEFFDNLQGLRDATGQKLAYVFTSFRTLNELVPSVFKKELLSVFVQSMYVKPAELEDINVIFETFQKRYQLTINKKTHDKILKLSGGHVQYLQLSLIILKEILQSAEELADGIEGLVLQDERINLQSEELWESLNDFEKNLLLEVSRKEEINEEKRDKGRYLWDTGFIAEKNTQLRIFSPIFEYFLREKSKSLKEVGNLDFTKKENLLFNFLKDNLDNLCDREKIIEVVWPEYAELGVSDWAVDRLVARVRGKLKKKKSPFEIVTIRTRGYKLTSQVGSSSTQEAPG